LSDVVGRIMDKLAIINWKFIVSFNFDLFDIQLKFAFRIRSLFRYSDQQFEVSPRQILDSVSNPMTLSF